MNFYVLTLRKSATMDSFSVTLQSEEELTDKEVVLGYLDMEKYTGYALGMVTEIDDDTFFDTCEWQGYYYSVERTDSIPTIRKIEIK